MGHEVSALALQDETRVLDAKVGEYVVIARRNKDKWFIGAITNDTGRTIEVNLDFLPENKKKATEVTNSTKLTMKLVRNGGWTGRIE